MRRQREIDLLAGISHPNVITLYEIYDEPKKMHLVMELVYGGELFDQIVVRHIPQRGLPRSTTSPACTTHAL